MDLCCVLTRTVFLPASFLYPSGGAEDESGVSEGRGDVWSLFVSEVVEEDFFPTRAFLDLSADLGVILGNGALLAVLTQSLDVLMISPILVGCM